MSHLIETDRTTTIGETVERAVAAYAARRSSLFRPASIAPTEAAQTAYAKVLLEKRDA